MWMKGKWEMKYGFGMKMVGKEKVGLVEYKLFEVKKEEMEMKEELEIK